MIRQYNFLYLEEAFAHARGFLADLGGVAKGAVGGELKAAASKGRGILKGLSQAEIERKALDYARRVEKDAARRDVIYNGILKWNAGQQNAKLMAPELAAKKQALGLAKQQMTTGGMSAAGEVAQKASDLTTYKRTMGQSFKDLAGTEGSYASRFNSAKQQAGKQSLVLRQTQLPSGGTMTASSMVPHGQASTLPTPKPVGSKSGRVYTPEQRAAIKERGQRVAQQRQMEWKKNRLEQIKQEQERAAKEARNKKWGERWDTTKKYAGKTWKGTKRVVGGAAATAAGATALGAGGLYAATSD